MGLHLRPNVGLHGSGLGVELDTDSVMWYGWMSSMILL